MILINSKSRLADYKAAYREAVLRVAELEAVKHQEKVLTIEDYRNDFQRRLSIHDVEFAAAVRDVMEGFNNAKKVVELFPIKNWFNRFLILSLSDLSPVPRLRDFFMSLIFLTRFLKKNGNRFN